MMDEEGLFKRKSKNIGTSDLFNFMNPKERDKYFEPDHKNGSLKYKKTVTIEDKNYLQKIIFNRLSYDEKLNYCERSENVKLEDEKIWVQINSHLETNAYSLEDLVQELGEKRFKHKLKVGDVFSGGGSIPFEAARMGIDVYTSDLNPIATLLTWASLNIYSKNANSNQELNAFQNIVFN